VTGDERIAEEHCLGHPAGQRRKPGSLRGTTQTIRWARRARRYIFIQPADFAAPQSSEKVTTIAPLATLPRASWSSPPAHPRKCRRIAQTRAARPVALGVEVQECAGGSSALLGASICWLQIAAYPTRFAGGSG